MRWSTVVVLALFALVSAPLAHATVLRADFDGLPEGTNGYAISDGGITFQDRLDGLAIEGGTDIGIGFSTPNYLTTHGYSQGAGLSLGSFHGMDIGFGSLLANHVGLRVLYAYAGPGTLVLEAFKGGALVGKDELELTSHSGWATSALMDLSGICFDGLKLSYSGPSYVFAGFDDVVVDDESKVRPVPEPGSLAMLGTGLLGLVGMGIRRARRERK
jgi:hypothetical protein